MKENGKKDLILDTMQKLISEKSSQAISVSDIAREAGIGKGSIYYYFKSKEEILEAVIERTYSKAIEESERLLKVSHLDALTKMEIIFRACRDSSSELLRQESSTFLEMQQSALVHQQYIRIIIKKLRPILADIIRQGNQEGTMYCESPDEVAEIALLILTIKFDNQLSLQPPEQIRKTLDVFIYMLETSFHIQKGRLDYMLNSVI
ncbi:MAG TPA: TetR/AcrR family transcriptional regulator [Candidatus Choladousia intestinavium]|uniref:TetR/AcrR family transcriptional regulator n=1 Tax=Candidatus Choladousia intestinavium TaxID=2840727 RepID=A0A9D1AG78_9FIRM|nr:TetR/AcrR family transcriptional regulator [Candidatus Choladousia intestinavium]